MSRDDAALLAATAAGDRDAFDAFTTRHQASVLRFLVRLAGSEADAQDVRQETFLAAWRGAGGFRGTSARAWLFTIARHALGRHRRRRAGAPATHDPLESLDVLGTAAGWGRDDGGRLLERLADREIVERALSALSPGEREVLVLRDVEGLTGEETAQALNLSPVAMKSRLHRARMALVARLRELSDA